MKNKDRVLQIRVDEKTSNSISKICKKEGITRSEFTRQCVDKEFFRRGLLN